MKLGIYNEGLVIQAILLMVDDVNHAEMIGPGGLRFFLFTGEI